MTMTPVESEAIHSIGFDPNTGTMRVKFKHGGVYDFGGVTVAKHEALLKSDSLGKHFHQHIRKHHVGTKVG